MTSPSPSVRRPTPRLDERPGLRVCHLGKFYPPARGGIENHVQALARGQAARGASTRVLCINHADERGEDVSWRALARTRTVRERDGAVEVVRIGRQVNAARLDIAARLPAVLRETVALGLDVLHLHVPNATFLVALAALPPPGVPLVITHHSDIVRQRFLRLAVRPLEELLYRRASLILATSPAYLEGSSLLQTHRAKVRTLPLGIDRAAWRQADPAALERVRTRVGGDDGPLWLSVGRLVYYKGLEVGVRALVDAPGRWAIVGTGPDGARLQALAASLGVAQRIVWLGEVSDAELAAAYHLATALWFPSNARSEAFGLVQVEAMSAGCPVINSAIPGSGVAWVCPHEAAGLTTPPDDARAFAAAARRLATEPGLRDALAAGARARAREFDQSELAGASLELYREALGAR